MTILTQIMDAKTGREVDAIVTKNLLLIQMKDRPFLNRFAMNAKKRIWRVNAEKNKPFKVYEKN